jgi:hypothetical protein
MFTPLLPPRTGITGSNGVVEVWSNGVFSIIWYQKWKLDTGNLTLV